ncbi:hypothetical protein K438DRAFT_1974699 [Mycena galopus ATCC 62051]|nr:hypothetical protein K438DRAFT_1974699 [Mycena galopus ATCC 62051]
MPVTLQGHRPARYPCASILRCASPQGCRCARDPARISLRGPSRTHIPASASPYPCPRLPAQIALHVSGSTDLPARISPHVKPRTYGGRHTGLHALHPCRYVGVGRSTHASPRVHVPAGGPVQEYPCASILTCASLQGCYCAHFPALVTPHGPPRTHIPARACPRPPPCTSVAVRTSPHVHRRNHVPAHPSLHGCRCKHLSARTSAALSSRLHGGGLEAGQWVHSSGSGWGEKGDNEKVVMVEETIEKMPGYKMNVSLGREGRRERTYVGRVIAAIEPQLQECELEGRSAWMHVAGNRRAMHTHHRTPLGPCPHVCTTLNGPHTLIRTSAPRPPCGAILATCPSTAVHTPRTHARVSPHGRMCTHHPTCISPHGHARAPLLVPPHTHLPAGDPAQGYPCRSILTCASPQGRRCTQWGDERERSKSSEEETSNKEKKKTQARPRTHVPAPNSPCASPRTHVAPPRTSLRTRPHTHVAVGRCTHIPPRTSLHATPPTQLPPRNSPHATPPTQLPACKSPHAGRCAHIPARTSLQSLRARPRTHVAAGRCAHIPARTSLRVRRRAQFPPHNSLHASHCAHVPARMSLRVHRRTQLPPCNSPRASPRTQVAARTSPHARR